MWRAGNPPSNTHQETVLVSFFGHGHGHGPVGPAAGAGVNDISGRSRPRLAALPRASAPSVGEQKPPPHEPGQTINVTARIERRQVSPGSSVWWAPARYWKTVAGIRNRLWNSSERRSASPGPGGRRPGHVHGEAVPGSVWKLHAPARLAEARRRAGLLTPCRRGEPADARGHRRGAAAPARDHGLRGARPRHRGPRRYT